MATYQTDYSPDRIMGLELMRSLFKDGCQWHGDVMSRRWAECLYVPDKTVQLKSMQTLQAYEEGRHYKIEGDAIWIC